MEIDLHIHMLKYAWFFLRREKIQQNDSEAEDLEKFHFPSYKNRITVD